MALRLSASRSQAELDRGPVAGGGRPALSLHRDTGREEQKEARCPSEVAGAVAWITCSTTKGQRKRAGLQGCGRVHLQL